ncbi:WD40-repeat-containing domain protein [Coemansia spiralis]|nr:WD40-repeat-containing domain protein [Coemansia spiralis]
MSAYRVASTFEERGIRPPSKEAVTVGESDLKFIHLCGGNDPALLQYVRNGGIAFPHIMIPEALQLHGATASAGASSNKSNGVESIMRKNSDTPSSGSSGKKQEQNGNIQDKSLAEASSALEIAFSHALWLWNAKQHASDFIQHTQTRALLLAESWLPSPLAAAVFGEVSGTLSAAKAEAMHVEEAKEQKEMLAKTEGPVACVAWHPHRSLIAIAHRATDTIFLYDLASDTWCANVLQNVYMQGITEIAWQPNCGYTLAVGCTAGVCLWTIMPPMAASNGGTATAASDDLKAPSLGSSQFSAWMTLLSFPPPTANAFPAQLPLDKKVAFRRSAASVSALTFSPSGQWLVTGHHMHGHLTVWDVALGTASPLKRSGSSSRSAALQVSVSPNGRYLASAHANGQLRLWETENWTSRVWSDLNGNITQFTWAPDSRSLFFAVANRPEIYALILFKAPVSIDAEIAVVTSFEAHMTAVLGDEEDTERIRVGGAIKSLALDPSGQRLVVGFDDDSASSDISLLAVYLVNTDALFRAGGDSSALMPLGYIRGPDWGKQQPQDAADRPSCFSSGTTEPASSKNEKLAKKRVRLGLPIPSWFGFAPSFDNGALLTVAWANGKVSFVPMLFRKSMSSR